MQKTYLSYSVFKKTSPLVQAFWVLSIAIIAMFIGVLLSGSDETAWFIGCASMGFYAWLNAVISFFITKKSAKYFGQSLLLFVLLSFILYFVADFLSESDVMSLYEYRTMYTVTVVFYILGSMVVALMRSIAQALRINY
ncbi:MAG: hypothetical protein R3E32_03310 [Chitinophagales bacterium]